MKTNQLMTIKIGTFGNIVIGHKKKLVRVNDILAIGNNYRASQGIKPITSLQSYFRKPTTWRTIIAIHNKMVERLERGKKSNSCDNYLKKEGKNPSSYRNYLKKEGKNANSAMHYLDLKSTMESLPRVKSTSRDMIDYQEILKTKQFNHIIKVQRGGKVENRGYYINLELMIDVAMMMNEAFKVELIDIFIEGKILEHRDNGGEAFKKLNKAIDTLPDRQPHLKPKGNKGVYINVAKMIREKLSIIDTKGYNEDEHNKIVQEKREEYINKLVMLIEMGFVTSYPQLKETIKKL